MKTSMSYNKYNKLLKETKELNPFERDYQECIATLLKQIAGKKGVKVVDVSDCPKDGSKIHDSAVYSGDNGTPDLLLISGYKYENIGLNCTYIASVEIKVPWQKWDKNCAVQVESHFSNKNNKNNKSYSENKINKVIWTNCYKWKFFEKDKAEAEGKEVKPTNEFTVENKKSFKDLKEHISAFIENNP